VKRRASSLAGAPSAANVSDPYIQEIANHALAEIDGRSNALYRQKVVRIVEAQKQVCFVLMCIVTDVCSMVYCSKIPFFINLPVVLHGCETWSLTLRDDHRLSVFENRVFRRTFGPKRDGVTGEWKKCHDEELHELYSSPNIVRVIKLRRMRWVEHVVQIREACTGIW
jgi:hypothetical protein